MGDRRPQSGMGGGGGGRGPGGGRGRGDGGRGGGGEGGAISREEGVRQAQLALQGLQLTAAKQMYEVGATIQTLAVRPSFGKAGHVTKALANYFRFEQKPNIVRMAVHYDVDILDVAAEQPGKKVAPADRALPPKLGQAIMQELAKQKKWGPGWGYDRRKNLYACKRILPQVSKHMVAIPEEGVRKGETKPCTKTFRVVIKEVALVDVGGLLTYMKESSEASAKGQAPKPGGQVVAADAHQNALQAFDTVLRWVGCNDPLCLAVGRNFYYYQGRNPPLGGGVLAWEGYTQAIKACQGGLMLNTDATFTGMVRAGPLIEVAAEMLDLRGPQQAFSRDQVKKLRKLLRGIRVVISGGPYPVRKMIRNVTEIGADQQRFRNEKENRDMSVSEYFANTGRRLKYPKLPCIDTSTVPGQPKYYPMELCTVQEGQRKSKLTTGQMAEMIKAAAQRPRDKQEYVSAVLQQLLPQAKPHMDAFGMEIKDRMVEVEARVLPAPPLAYGGSTCFNAGTEGSWNLRNTTFLEGGRLDSWAVASLMRREDAERDFPLSEFLRDLYQMLRKCGMQVANGFPMPAYWDGASNLTDLFRKAMQQGKAAFGNKNPQLLLVLLPVKDVGLYKQVKLFSDSQAGIPSQCFVANKAGVGPRNEPKGRPQYTANLALKINAKMDGVNAGFVAPSQAKPYDLVPILRTFEHVCVMGADVTHPAPGSRGDEGARSVAAIVGSKNRGATKFATRLQLQPPSDYEVITNLEVAVKALLVQYYQNTKAKPQAILFYRDGVAEGQFQEVLRYELAAIKKACASLEQGYNPPITFIVVQKRHNTRLLPAPNTPTHRSGNVVPGLVVDRTICSPHNYDFFLNSHAGLQGTNKPAHYTVLVDEIGCSADAVQLLTYWLCYTYCRATKSVSYVAPSYYAHLAAFRGRVLLGETDSSSESSGASAAPVFSNVHLAIENTLYYV